MSQYALFLKKKNRSRSTRYLFDKRSASSHNGYELGKVFGVPYNDTFINRLLFYLFRFLSIERLPLISKPLINLFKFLGVEIIKENYNYDFDEKILQPAKGIKFYFGGWHSEKYFTEVKEEVLTSFSFKTLDDSENKNMLERIKTSNSISVHVRRGDFFSDANKEKFGGICTKQYFDEAINMITKQVKNPLFFVFSNDVDWVTDNLKYENIIIVNCNSGKSSWKDMYLMSFCKHNINSNSTFSWWSAWLNRSTEKIIIVPFHFIQNIGTKDIYPESWTKLYNY